MAAGLDSELRDMEWVVGRIQAREPRPGLVRKVQDFK